MFSALAEAKSGAWHYHADHSFYWLQTVSGINNNAIKNLNGQQKEFHKIRRGVNEVQNYADGFKVFHNFVRKGVKDNLTPAERCGIGIKGNRWEGMLINSLKVPNATGGQKMAKSPAD